MPEYRQHDEPPLARLAAERAARLGFSRSCSPETGRFLATLAATVREGSILELGSGAGDGTAWIASTLMPGSTLQTVEIEAAFASSCEELFNQDPRLSVTCGTWDSVLTQGPFDMIFVDVAAAKTDGIDAVDAALSPGGIAVVDDLTPLEIWPDEWKGKPDPVRDAWLGHPALVATEIRLTGDQAAIMAVKL